MTTAAAETWNRFGLFCRLLFRVAAVLAAFLTLIGTADALEGGANQPLAESRKAFVVGINDYQNVESLDRAVDDAKAIAETLTSRGFVVDLVENPSRSVLLQRFVKFRNSVRKDDVVLFYFAGHGISIDGGTYLLPGDIPDLEPQNAVLVQNEGIGAHTVIEWLHGQDPRVVMLILDACREAPFQVTRGRSAWKSRGLTPLESTEGTFVIYSAGYGQVALDGLPGEVGEKNSLFTRVLRRKMLTPGLELRRLAHEVRSEVHSLTRREAGVSQIPAYQDELLGDFYFTRTESQADAPAQITPDDEISGIGELVANIPLGDVPAPIFAPSIPLDILDSDDGLAPSPSNKFTQRLMGDGRETDAGPASGNGDANSGVTTSAMSVPPAGNTGVIDPADRPNPSPPQTSDGSTPLISDPYGSYRAIFYEERTASSAGSAQQGNVVWSLVKESSGLGLPSEEAARADANIPALDLRLRMTIRRNEDPTLPATHVVELIFLTPKSFEGGVIDNLLRMTMKETEAETGFQLLGLPAKVDDGFFLIALSDNVAEVEANLNLFRSMKWIDIPIVYRSGRRALMTLELGHSGREILEKLINDWDRDRNSRRLSKKEGLRTQSVTAPPENALDPKRSDNMPSPSVKSTRAEKKCIIFAGVTKCK